MAIDQSLGTAFVEIKANLAGLQAGLTKAQVIVNKSAKRLNGIFKKVGIQLGVLAKRFRQNSEQIASGFKKIGRNLTLFVTAPLLALGAASTKTALTFGSSLTKLRTLVGLTADEVEFLKQGILDIGPAVGKGPDELAQALFPIVSAGARGEEALNRLRLSAIGSALGMGEVIVPATALNKILATFGDQVESSDEAMGIFLKTLEAADAPPEALARAFTFILPQAKALSVSLRDVSGVLAFVTKATASASSAASGLRGVLSKLKKPPEEMRKELEKAGLSLEELQRTAGEEGLVAALRKLANVFPTTSLEFARFFEDQEALNAALIILDGNVAELDRTMRTVARAGAKDVANALKILEEDAAFKLEKAFAAINKTFTVLGESIIPKIIPAIESFTEKISAVAEAFAGLDAETQGSILFTGALLAALGPVLLVFGSLIGIVGNLSKAFIFLGTVLRINPLFLVGTAVALLVIGFSQLFGATEKVVKVSEEHATAMREIKRLTDEAAGASGKRKTALLQEASAEAVATREIALRRKAAADAALAEFKAQPGFPITGDLPEFDITGQITKFGLLAQESRSANLEVEQLTDKIFRLDQEIVAASFSAEILAASEEEIAAAAAAAAAAEKELADAAEAARIALEKETKALEEQRTALADLLDRLFPIQKAVRDFLDEARLLGESFKIGDLDDEEFRLALAALVAEAKAAGIEISKAISGGIKQGSEEGGDEGEKILTATEQAIKDVVTNVAFAVGRTIKGMITGATSLMDGLRNLALNVIDIILEAIIKAAVLKLISGLFPGSETASAKGNVFSGGALVPFQRGGLISGRTTFPMGLAGEAGPEAIFPLTRMPGGEMGIRAEMGGGQPVIVNQTINFDTVVRNDMFATIAQAAPLLIEASRSATIEALQGRRT